MDPDRHRRVVGTTLSHYRILEKLGEGGMGEVYLAQDTKLERHVALKILPPVFANDRDRLERFEREAKALAALDHPNIVTIFSVESAAPVGPAERGDGLDPVHFLTMQRIEGQTLGELIPRGGMPLTLLLDVSTQMVAAVAAAHEKGITHRDLKPGNVMVSAQGRVRVLDFGLAKVSVPSADPEATELPTLALTQEGLMVGTVPYMSPEQAMGKPVDTRSDIFTLGVILYEMVTGFRPFGEKASVDLVLAIVQESPRPIAERRPDLPEKLDDVITRCLEKEPERRYQSTLDLQRDLEEIRDGAVEPSAGGAGGRRWTGGLAVVLVLLLAVAGFAGWSWLRGRSGRGVIEIASRSAGARASVTRADGLIAKRVLVVPFENRTGDPSLDPVGPMAADWITQGLSQTGLVEVVSSMTALISWRNLARTELEERREFNMAELAEDTGAGTVISGAYYLQNGEFLFSAEANDVAAGQLLGAVEPCRSTVDAPLAAVEELRQRLMVIVASHLDERLRSSEHSLRLPSFDAYREHAMGVEQFIQMDFRAAIDHLNRAAELDPDWPQPLLTAAMAWINLGDFARAEALAASAALYRDALSTLDQHFLDRILATCHEQPLEALRFARMNAELSPEGPSAFDAGALAMRTNHAQEAVDRLEALDPERGFLRGFAPYWHYLTESHHILGEYEAELESARRARKVHPDQLEPRWYEIRALVGMGRLEEIESMLDAAEALPASMVTPGWVMEMTAAELRAHGYHEAGKRVAQRAVQWYRDRPEGQGPQEVWKVSIGRSLILAGDFDEAVPIFAALVAERPEELEYRGSLGVLSARRSDRQAALEELEWLQRVDRPYLFGAQYFWQSAIYAWQGDLDQAVRLYREALAAGLPFGWQRIHPHADPMLEPLWDHPPFQQLIAPRD